MSEVTGLGELQRNFTRLREAVPASELSDIMAGIVFDISQTLVPVDTGDLRDSGEIAQEGDAFVVQYLADHAAHVEFGTSRMAAQPFLRPAMARAEEIVKAVEEKAKEEIGL